MKIDFDVDIDMANRDDFPLVNVPTQVLKRMVNLPNTILVSTFKTFQCFHLKVIAQ